MTYAIGFDLDIKILEQTYHDKSWQNAYSDIEPALAKYGLMSLLSFSAAPGTSLHGASNGLMKIEPKWVAGRF